MTRRDEYGWLTFPFWTTLCRITPGWFYRWRLTNWFWFEVMSRAYEEDMRWDLAHNPQGTAR